MHPPPVRDAALALAAAGIDDGEIARRLGVPRTTVRDWRAPRYVPIHDERCPRCWRRTRPIRLAAPDYAELLGLYLGDGCVSRVGRSYSLRIHLDAKYPAIVAETERILGRCFPANRVGRVDRPDESCVVPWVYSGHMPCVLPQHGAGKKHERDLRLEAWQRESVERAPWSFLRGLVWSDGSSFMNRTGPYEYLSFEFSNLSEDLLSMFAATCELVGVSYRRYPVVLRAGRLRVGRVRINCRADVALFEKHVGVKR